MATNLDMGYMVDNCNYDHSWAIGPRFCPLMANLESD